MLCIVYCDFIQTALHNQGLIHTDLKPENLLLAKPLIEEYAAGRNNASSSRTSSNSYYLPQNTEIRMIDMGNSTFECSYHSRIIGTRHYRAPEVLLELGWSFPSDIWAIGCILMEFYTGEVLFHPHDDLEHLGMIEYVLGPISERMVLRSKYRIVLLLPLTFHSPYMNSKLSFIIF